MESDRSKIDAIIGSFKGAVRRFIRSLPIGFRILTDITIAGLSDTYRHRRLPAYLVRGRLFANEFDGTLIYFGQFPQNKSWIANFFFEATPAEYIGDFSLLEIVLLKGVLSECDVLLCPINPLSSCMFSLNGWLVAPKYVKCLIDLSKPIEQLTCRHTAKDDLRIVRKKKYHFDILSDDASFDEFYNDMLLPTVTARHEDRAHISSLETLRNVFHKGYLLAAYQEGEWVGANLMLPQSGKVLNWANVGWRAGSEQLMKDRVVSALLYEMIVRGKDEEFITLDLGSCSPFVNDGPLNYKLKWGAHMSLPFMGYEDEQLQGVNAYFGIHFNLASHSARSMLKHSPILSKKKNSLCVIGWDSKIRSDFKHQFDNGLEWADLSANNLDAKL